MSDVRKQWTAAIVLLVLAAGLVLAPAADRQTHDHGAHGRSAGPSVVHGGDAGSPAVPGDHFLCQFCQLISASSLPGAPVFVAASVAPALPALAGVAATSWRGESRFLPVGSRAPPPSA